MPRQLLGTAIAANTITTTQLQTTIVQNIESGGGPRVTSLVYPGDDTAANTVGGQTVYINGSGFASNSAVYINGNSAPSVSFISSSNLAITTPALSAATYPVYVINPENGATAIFIPGLLISGDPTWVTSAGSLSASQDASSAWSYSVSATSDSAVTYALASGSSLPTGISLAANGLISGTMSSPPESETTYNFTVEAIDAENQNATRAFSVTVSTGEGVLFANNVLLIHADGTNNGNNQSFVESTASLTVTRTGAANQGSVSPFAQTGWSGYFDGTGDYLTAPNNAALEFGTGDFTVECWVNSFDKSANKVIAYLYNSPTNYNGWQLRIDSGGNGYATITVFGGSSPLETNVTGTSNICDGKWHHIAAVRSGTTLSIFVDGVREATTTNSYNITSTATFHIGRDAATSTRDWGGYISNLRIIKGSGPYDATLSSLTSPSAPLAPIANTSLLALQSNRLVDEGPNNLTLTRNGDVSVRAFSPFAPGLLTSNSHSVYFDGSGDYLTTSANAAFGFGIESFTIEAWVYPTNNPANGPGTLLDLRSGTNAEGAVVRIFSNNVIGIYDGPNNTYLYSSGTVSMNTWSHIAIVRSNTSTNGTAFYINGVASGTTTLASNLGTSWVARIGSNYTASYDYYGYMSNLRVVKGTAVYTGAFTPPTSALTAITNTSLLTCQSTTFVDNSTNAFTITPNGNAVPRKFNPFGQTYTSTAYSTADVGGAVYIPSGTNGLTVGSVPAIGTGSFTVEGWFWPTTTGEFPSAWTINVADFNGSSSMQGGVGTGVINFRYNGQSGFNITSGINLANQWNHIAWVRNGSAANVYLNGVSVGSGSFTNSLSAGNMYISRPDSSAFRYDGWVSGFRVVSGTALYTANFTPPTAPPTSSSNAICLLNFTDGQVIDYTAKNILELVGDTKVSTAQFKYGTGSVAFDGTGDYIKILKNVTLLDFDTGDFTVETWVRFNTVGIDQAIFAGDTTNGSYDFVYRNGQGLVVGRYNTAWDNTFSWSPSINTWYHIAWCRSGTSLKAFVDGVQIGSTATNSTAYNGGTTFSAIGASAGGGDRLLNGFLDDLRITKGYARYTSNFTPPTSALKDK